MRGRERREREEEGWRKEEEGEGGRGRREEEETCITASTNAVHAPPAKAVSEQDLVGCQDGSRIISDARIRSRRARSPTVGFDSSHKIFILGGGHSVDFINQ